MSGDASLTQQQVNCTGLRRECYCSIGMHKHPYTCLLYIYIHVCYTYKHAHTYLQFSIIHAFCISTRFMTMTSDLAKT